MNTDSLIQYHVKNSFNNDVLKEVKKVVFSAKTDGFPNVLNRWVRLLNEMINLDMNDIEINKDYIEEAKYDNKMMIHYIYNIK